MPIYSPGNEPDRIKDRIKTLFERIDSAYPDKIIVGLHSNHKKMGETVSEIYKALGYESGKDFLEAYGYKCEKKASGRPKSVDPHAIIKALQGKYPNGSPFDTVDDLFSDNPEYLPKLKSLKNASSEVFGMPLKRYLLTLATVYKGNIIKNLIMDCQSYTKYRPNETTGGIFVSWRRKEELPTGA